MCTVNQDAQVMMSGSAHEQSGCNHSFRSNIGSHMEALHGSCCLATQHGSKVWLAFECQRSFCRHSLPVVNVGLSNVSFSFHSVGTATA